jgi:CO dehydrogenase maturation factor
MHKSGKTRVIALCGKGGVGKTSLSAAIVKILTQNPENRVLAIDADPAIGLAPCLGFRVEKTVDDIRNSLVQQVMDGKKQDPDDVVSRLDYEMFSALKERGNLAFLAIGRPEKEGCYCQVNHILKDIISSIAVNFDYVVIDGEAGVEQVNRRVMETVSHLILVSDASARGLNVAKTIKEVSDSSISYEKAGLILNRVRTAAEVENLSIPDALDCLGWVPEDDVIRQYDIEGKSILGLSTSPGLDAAKRCMAAMEV